MKNAPDEKLPALVEDGGANWLPTAPKTESAVKGAPVDVRPTSLPVRVMATVWSVGQIELCAAPNLKIVARTRSTKRDCMMRIWLPKCARARNCLGGEQPSVVDGYSFLVP